MSLASQWSRNIRLSAWAAGMALLLAVGQFGVATSVDCGGFTPTDGHVTMRVMDSMSTMAKQAQPSGCAHCRSQHRSTECPGLHGCVMPTAISTSALTIPTLVRVVMDPPWAAPSRLHRLSVPPPLRPPAG